jgi:hypothetical protein
VNRAHATRLISQEAEGATSHLQVETKLSNVGEGAMPWHSLCQRQKSSEDKEQNDGDGQHKKLTQKFKLNAC